MLRQQKQIELYRYQKRFGKYGCNFALTKNFKTMNLNQNYKL